jgi:hypothetical protein
MKKKSSKIGLVRASNAFFSIQLEIDLSAALGLSFEILNKGIIKLKIQITTHTKSTKDIKGKSTLAGK